MVISWALKQKTQSMFLVDYMGVSENGGTQNNHFNRVFHYKPSILGYPYFWKHPYGLSPNLVPINMSLVGGLGVPSNPSPTRQRREVGPNLGGVN